MHELKRNISNFGYGINFKYEVMLSHSFDRFCVVKKFILQLSVILNVHQLILIQNVVIYMSNFCTKIVLFVDIYKNQIDYYNKTVHDILKRNSFDTSKFSKE